MTPEAAVPAVAVRFPGKGYAGSTSVGAVAAGAPAQVATSDTIITTAQAGLPRGVRRVLSALGDVIGLVAVAYTFPLVILAIGIPVALLVRLAIWIVRAL